MKLNKKKQLAARTLGVGKGRIWFNPARLDDVKEAITKQDINELVKDKAIKIKPITGRLKKEKGKRRREGKIKKTVRRRKKEYMMRIRKLRRYLKFFKANNEISRGDYSRLRRHAKSGVFTGLKQLKEHVASMRKEGQHEAPEKSKKQRRRKTE